MNLHRSLLSSSLLATLAWSALTATVSVLSLPQLVFGFVPLSQHQQKHQHQQKQSATTFSRFNINPNNNNNNMSVVRLQMAPSQSSSLKPAAIPLMDSGKALARSGELLIDLTTAMDMYGGSLSAAGAQIRNSGDCLAQAAASCRFKTAQELVCDELRESATCLLEATGKLRSGAINEAKADENLELANNIESMVENIEMAGILLEKAGECLMKGQSVTEIGGNLERCGAQLQALAVKIPSLAPEKSDATLSSQRMNYAAEKMMEAGKELQGTPKSKPMGKGWLKG